MDETNMAAPQPEVTAIPPNLIFENATTKHIDLQDFQEHPTLQNPFPQVIKISRYTKDSGPLTKVMRLVDGVLCKDGSGCRMNRGKVEQCSLGSMGELAFLLQSLGLNQAVSLGVTDSDSIKTITTRDKETGDTISRTKRHIRFRPSEPAFMLWDLDQSRDNAVYADEKAGIGCQPERLMEIVTDFFPSIRHASWLMRPSTSAGIYDRSGKLLKGEGAGFHIYLPVRDGSDIPRFIEVMGKRLILAGYGRVEFSRSGHMLVRTLIDLLVGSPERLVFEAGALCQDGLVQRLPTPRINEGAVLDTRLLPSLSADESRQYEDAVSAAKTRASPVQAKISAQYIETESERLMASRSCSHAEAEKIVRSRQFLQLADDDFLFFQHASSPVSVQDTLKKGATLNNRRLADPLEPEYDGGNTSKAIFYWNNGKNPIIKSFAHGERIYSFTRYDMQQPGGSGAKNLSKCYRRRENAKKCRFQNAVL